MSTSPFQDVRCPRCGHKLFQACGISAHLVIRIKCPSRECRDGIVQIREGFVAEIIQTTTMTST
jgi:phage FluMu protein Com